MGDLFLASETAAEILLVLGVSFVGASVHEYVFRSEDNRAFFKNPNIWISTMVSSIICYTINPWMSSLFNPRLLLLPPLLLGMAGMDLVKRLATPEGSSSLVEYILGFFGVTNKKTNGPYGIPSSSSSEEEEQQSQSNNSNVDHSNIMLHSPVLSTANFEHLMSLDQMVTTILDSICNLIVEYYVHKDKESFLRGYVTIKTNMRIMKTHMSAYQVIPITTALKLSEILKKEIELDHIYGDITKQDEPEGSTTSN